LGAGAAVDGGWVLVLVAGVVLLVGVLLVVCWCLGDLVVGCWCWWLGCWWLGDQLLLVVGWLCSGAGGWLPVAGGWVLWCWCLGAGGAGANGWVQVLVVGVLVVVCWCLDPGAGDAVAGGRMLV
jgi:hypothetical protein